MNLLDPTLLRDKCDYSFGDLSGIYTGGDPVINSHLRDANSLNNEFMETLHRISKYRNYMTLFIDNIRLYKRPVKYSACELTNTSSRDFKDKIVNHFHKTNDLLELCSRINNMNFIIFTGFDDSPIDDYIFERIPDNVISIYASNSISFGGKVRPIPYGIKRKININDDNHELLKYYSTIDFDPSKMLYMNHNVNNNPDRVQISNHFSNKYWCTIENNKKYKDYLLSIKEHRFMICPSGNAIGCDCHRDWEVLYMRRVPVVIDSPYLREVFKDHPVLFVESFTDITEELLSDNIHLLEKARKFDLEKMNFSKLFNDYISESLKK